jgi:hypothetical protein
MRARKVFPALGCAALLAGLAWAAPVPVPTPPEGMRPASSPEELVRFLHKLEQKGVDRAMLAYVGGPHRPLVLQCFAVVRALEGVEDALDAKFGKDPAYRRKFSYKRPRARTVEVQARKTLGKDRVELQLRTTRPDDKGKDEVWLTRLIAVKEKGSWKMEATLPFSAVYIVPETRKTPDGRTETVMVEIPRKEPTAAEVKRVKEALARAKGQFSKLAKEVGEGKFRSRAEALEVADGLLEKLFPPPPFTPGKEPG